MTAAQHLDTPLANLGRILADAELEADIVATVGTRITAGGPAFALIAYDVDNSAQIRALSIGHKIAVLEELLAYVRTCAPPDATVLGHGTRDDIVVLTNLATEAPAAEAMAIAETIRTAVAACQLGARLGLRLQLTISAGIALSPQASTDPLDLFLLADSACRSAKQQGRNRCVLAPLSFDASVEGTLCVERMAALTQLSTRTGKTVEQLLRSAIQLVLQRHSGLERFCHGATLQDE